MRFTVSATKCRCHPESCNCDPWTVYEHGDPWIKVFRRKDADRIAEWMNTVCFISKQDDKAGNWAVEKCRAMTRN